MGRHNIRKHTAGPAETRTGVVSPVWPTLDRQPTEPFSVNLARCRKCGDALRAVAGGTWVGRRTNDAICHSSGRWPWSSRAHVIDATPLADRPPWWALALPIVILGPLLLVLTAVLATWLGNR